MIIVMSAVSYDGSSRNRKRCFETNATGFPDIATAEIEAARRNAMELAAGHTNVEWFVSELPDELLKLCEAFK